MVRRTLRIGHYFPMRLDHVSYVTSHEQISDTVQRIGSQIGTAFVDGGIHPQFGTRNFTAPLLNNQYIEIVCALDHPAAERTPFGQAVTKKAEEGGGWLSWVFQVDSIDPLEKIFDRDSIVGHRRLPTGEELSWRQIGVSELVALRWTPFFIEWLSGTHPTNNGRAIAELDSIALNVDRKTTLDYFERIAAVDQLKKLVTFIEVGDSQIPKGIESMNFNVNGKKVIID